MDPTENKKELAPEGLHAGHACPQKGGSTGKPGKGLEEFQVEIQHSPVSNAAQRLKRAIALALQAAARAADSPQPDISQTPKASDSE